MVFTGFSCSNNSGPSDVKVPEFITFNSSHDSQYVYMAFDEGFEDAFSLLPPIAGWTTITLDADQKTMDFDILDQTITCNIEKTRNGVRYYGENNCLKVDFTINEDGEIDYSSTIIYESNYEDIYGSDDEDAYNIPVYFIGKYDASGKIEKNFFVGKADGFFGILEKDTREKGFDSSISRIQFNNFEISLTDDNSFKILTYRQGEKFCYDCYTNTKNLSFDDLEQTKFDISKVKPDKDTYVEDSAWGYMLKDGVFIQFNEDN